MFKLISKNKNDIMFQQNSELKSIFFLKEGEIKFETYLSAIDIHNLIKYYIDYMTIKKKYLKLSDEQIDNLKKYYLNDKDLINGDNKGIIYIEKIKEVQKYEIYSTKNYESLGILEFASLMNTYTTSCYVISKNAKFFEINKENLNKILKREKDMIKQDYYKLIKNKMLIQIKRLFYLKLNFLSNILYKINANFYNINNNIWNFNHNHFNSESNKNNSKNNLSKSKSILFEENKNDNINKNIESPINAITPYSQRNDNIKINKQIKNNSFSKYFGHFNYDFKKNNNWSPVTLKYTKYNEKYFINEKLNLLNKNNIDKNANILNNSDPNINYNDIIKTLLSLDPKKQKNNKYSLKSPSKEILNLKKMINIGNNHIFSLEQLKTKMEKNKISENMLNLSIVKNEIHNKSMNSSLLNKKNEKMKRSFISKNDNIKSFLSHKNKNNSLFKFKKIKLRRNYKIQKREFSNSLSEIITLDSNINNNLIISHEKKNNSHQKKEGNIKLKDVLKKSRCKSHKKIYIKKKYFDI